MDSDEELNDEGNSGARKRERALKIGVRIKLGDAFDPEREWAGDAREDWPAFAGAASMARAGRGHTQ